MQQVVLSTLLQLFLFLLYVILNIIQDFDSIAIPGLIVLDIKILLIYIPFAAEGLSFTIVLIIHLHFLILSAVKDTFPTEA